ncbi:MAG: alpha/beta fold hydrolase [Deltaproteobacteria bacterium]|nr:alpha/beta fold hydrolase [Deltaproteobacteria bacterium]
MTEPLVLVPGLLCTARLFAPQVAAFGGGRPVIVADHSRGATLAEIAAHILAAAPPRFALAGLSMGGGIALQMWAQAPARISRLAILDSSPLADTPESSAQRRALIGLSERGEFRAAAAQLAPSFIGRRFAADAALQATVAAMAEETGAAIFIRHEQAQIARPDARPLLPTIDCPTLVLVGGEDELTPPPLSIDMAAAIRGARLVIVEACGHLSTLEAPPAVNRALADWLAAGR